MGHVSGLQSLLHYLNDFPFEGSANSDQCHVLLSSFQDICGQLGILLLADKTEGLVHVLSFLGIEIYTAWMVSCLLGDKLARLLSLVRLALDTRKIQLQQLQSLLGHLVSVCRVMPMGRAFSRHLS